MVGADSFAPLEPGQGAGQQGGTAHLATCGGGDVKCRSQSLNRREAPKRRILRTSSRFILPKNKTKKNTFENPLEIRKSWHSVRYTHTQITHSCFVMKCEKWKEPKELTYCAEVEDTSGRPGLSFHNKERRGSPVHRY